MPDDRCRACGGFNPCDNPFCDGTYVSVLGNPVPVRGAVVDETRHVPVPIDPALLQGCPVCWFVVCQCVTVPDDFVPAEHDPACYGGTIEDDEGHPVGECPTCSTTPDDHDPQVARVIGQLAAYHGRTLEDTTTITVTLTLDPDLLDDQIELINRAKHTRALARVGTDDALLLDGVLSLLRALRESCSKL